jgi:predicted TIM-barrel fold metal-dependent hydrolase
MFPIVDTHLHFLDFNRFDYPWTEDPEWRFLRKGYLPQDWKGDVGQRRVIAGVHVQAEVDHSTDPVAETSWLASLPEPVAPMFYVAYADLRAGDLDDVLCRHREFSAVRGIRQEAWFDPTSTRADMPRENMLLDPTWRSGLKRLVEHDLSFDLLVWSHQLKQAADVFAEIPELPLIVEHTGMPTLDDPSAMEQWRVGLAQIAERVPQAVLKISAMALFVGGWTSDRIRPIVLEALEHFGPDRCMLGSNYPVDSGIADYETIWAGYDEVLAELTDDERTAIFSGTALQAYRIDPSR